MTGRVSMNQIDSPPINPSMNAADAIICQGRQAAGDDGLAIIEEQRTFSYRQLDELINQFGNGMQHHNVQRENRVLFLMDDCAELVAAYFAAIRIGAVAVAVSLRVAAKDLKHIITESRAVLLFVDAGLLPVYRQIENELHDKPILIINGAPHGQEESVAGFASGEDTALNSVLMSPDDMALWIYSSGTTGQPKAVVHMHHDVLVADLHLSRNLNGKPGQRLFCTSKLFFAYALGNSMLAGLRSGMAIVLASGWPDARHIVEVIEQYKPDFFFSVPTFYRTLLTSGEARNPAFKQLRCCVSAGEALPETLFKKWRDQTGLCIHEGLGSSETIFLYIANYPDNFQIGKTGRLQPWVEARLLDETQHEINTPDTPGMLWIKTESVADRYWNRQQLSRATFVGEWYCTGDMLSVDSDGWWCYHGRQDSMLKISGQWVSPAEIEDRAMSAQNVLEAAVVGRVDKDGLVRATLFVVPQHPVDDQDSYCEHVHAHLCDGLSVYKCPRNIRVVEALPRTETGKVKHFVLRQWLDQT